MSFCIQGTHDDFTSSGWKLGSNIYEEWIQILEKLEMDITKWNKTPKNFVMI